MVPKTDAYHYTKLSKPVTVCHPDAESFITTATSGDTSECSTGINKVRTTYLVHTYTLDTFQDFLIAHETRYFFTKLCQCQTYKNSKIS